MGADGVIHNTKTRRHEHRVRPTAVTRPSAHGSRLAGCTPRERGTGGGTGPRGAWSEHGARNHDLTTTQQGQPLCSRPMAPPRLWLVWHVWHICGAVCCSILFIHVPMDSTQRVLLPSVRLSVCPSVRQPILYLLLSVRLSLNSVCRWVVNHCTVIVSPSCHNIDMVQ